MKLKITQEKPWARLSPRPTGRDLVTLIQNLRTDADHGLLGDLPRLYSNMNGDSSRDIAPPGLGRRRFSLQPLPTPTKRKPDLKEANQDNQTTVIYQAGQTGLTLSGRRKAAARDSRNRQTTNNLTASLRSPRLPASAPRYARGFGGQGRRGSLR